jgi:16S rRNA (adenine1518-N6/adenine1519-N6)-dimethyltransferase
MTSDARQTISYLTRRFADVGIRPQNRFGQNFLIDLNLVDLLVRAAEIGPNDVVLEIGTGMGSLTGRLAEQAAVVVTVEVDRNLQQLAREELEAHDNIRFLQMDALRSKHNLNPAVIDAVQKELAADPARRFKVAANLPYSIATPVLSNLLTAAVVPESMTVTIQKELADRIMARPSTKDYSALSIWVQALCEVELIRELPPSVFWPRPKVDSAIVQIRPQDSKRSRIAVLDYFQQFVRSLFFHRRKFLRSVLVSAMQDQMDKAAVDAVLGNLQLGANCRAEELSVEQVIELCDAFRTAEKGEGVRTEAEEKDKR